MSKKLKVDLHIHTSDETLETIKHSAFDLIDAASHKGFDVLSITNHNIVTYSEELAHYAEEKEILLIPGLEATFSNKHVLIINPDFTKSSFNRPLTDLAKIKNDDNLIIAPHPFYPSFRSLRSQLLPFIKFFDAIEFSHYYNHYINCNKKALEIAQQYRKPLIGTSDCHFLNKLDTNFSLVEAEKDTQSIIAAIKKGKVEVCSTPLSLLSMTNMAINLFLLNRKKITSRIRAFPSKDISED